MELIRCEKVTFELVRTQGPVYIYHEQLQLVSLDEVLLLRG
jgi:hypothetical protein